jgi:MoxR-like ATPase
MSRSPQSIGIRRPAAARGSRGGSARAVGEELSGARFSISLGSLPGKGERAYGLTSTTPINAPPTDLVAEVEALGERLSLVRERIGEVIFGQREVVEQALITLLSGGHALLIGVPGLAKTRLVETLGTILSLDDKRIQCTPDLMPADILGSEVLEESEAGRRSFRFIPGPVFCQLLMADEINRASPRTQSALLQAMQEGRVSIAGQYHPLPRPFHVLATQNPLEQEGTYPLPEAQLDRFLLQIDVDYPDVDSERRMLIATTGISEQEPRPAMTVSELSAAQMLVRRIPVGESVVEAILRLVRSGRPDEAPPAGDARRFVAWGPGPRASQALMLACRARALIEGRFSPSVDDVLALAAPVLRHRMAVSFAGRAEGVTVAQVIEQMAAPLR